MFGERHKVSTVNAIDIGKHYDLVKPNVDALALEVIRQLVWKKNSFSRNHINIEYSVLFINFIFVIKNFQFPSITIIEGIVHYLLDG